MVYEKTPYELLSDLDVVASSSATIFREIPLESLEFKTIETQTEDRVKHQGIRATHDSDLYLGFLAGNTFLPIDTKEGNFKDLYLLEWEKGTVIKGEVYHPTTWIEEIPHSAPFRVEYTEKSA